MVTKVEFDAMGAVEQIELVNSYLAQSKTLSDICEKEKLIEISRKALRNRFLKINYEYNAGLNRYVHKDNIETHKQGEYKDTQKVPQETKKNEGNEYKNNINVPIPAHKNIEKVHTQESTNVYQPKEIVEILQATTQMQEQFKEMWAWYNNQKNIIEIPILKIDNIFDDEVIAKTFRVHKDVLNNFLQMCEKHKEYKQQTIVSKALLEFIEKYDR